jgi:hypothetical protein
MSVRPLLLVVLAALTACAGDSFADIQAAACLQLEECAPETFSAQYTSQEACVDADADFAACYDLHCTYLPQAAVDCQDEIEAQACGGVDLRQTFCAFESLWKSCDAAGLSTCLADLEGS